MRRPRSRLTVVSPTAAELHCDRRLRADGSAYFADAEPSFFPCLELTAVPAVEHETNAGKPRYSRRWLPSWFGRPGLVRTPRGVAKLEIVRRGYSCQPMLNAASFGKN